MSTCATTLRSLSALALVALLATGCEKEITVDLPNLPQRLVIDGSIETGRPPIVLITRTESYFEPTDLQSLKGIFVREAEVTVDNGSGPIRLDRICGGSLSGDELNAFALAVGLDPFLVAAANICAYTTDNPALFGETGRTYHLRVVAEGHELKARTTIPNAVALDSVSYDPIDIRDGGDSLGLIRGSMTDPDTLGNYYRWMARRINKRFGSVAKDPIFISPIGSTFDDRYFNGLQVSNMFIRGRQFYSGQSEDDNEEQGYFKVGDTVAIKYISINEPEYWFYRSYETNLTSAGDMFGTPANIRTNVEGGLGIWAGWGTYHDTLVCRNP